MHNHLFQIQRHCDTNDLLGSVDAFVPVASTSPQCTSRRMGKMALPLLLVVFVVLVVLLVVVANRKSAVPPSYGLNPPH